MLVAGKNEDPDLHRSAGLLDYPPIRALAQDTALLTAMLIYLKVVRLMH